MKSFVFQAEGDPKPQPRTRIGRTKGGFSVAYDPGSARSWKENVMLAAKQVRPAAPLEGPLSIQVYLRFDRPAGHRKKDGTVKPTAPVWVAGKGRNDVDNCLKAVMDALNDIRFWADDGLVSDARVAKRYVGNGERPGALIVIETLEVTEE